MCVFFCVEIFNMGIQKAKSHDQTLMLKGRTKSAYGGVGTRKCELRLIEENKQGTHRRQAFPVCKLILGISQMLPALGTEKPFPTGP